MPDNPALLLPKRLELAANAIIILPGFQSPAASGEDASQGLRFPRQEKVSATFLSRDETNRSSVHQNLRKTIHWGHNPKAFLAVKGVNGCQ